jgi:uncharacterized protein
MRAFGLALLLLVGCDASSQPQEPQAVAADPGPAEPAAELPALTGRVVDSAEILSPAQEAALTETSAALERRTTDQLVVVTLASLRGMTIEAAGLTLGNRWGIGQAGKDNGVLLIVAPNDRKVRIEVAYGLEPILTNERAQTIIDRDMLPPFREGRLADGIAAGTDAVARLLLEHANTPRMGRS